MELAFLEATWATLDPVGITNRWINHTIHPAQTPGTLTRSCRVGHEFFELRRRHGQGRCPARSQLLRCEDESRQLGVV